MASEAIIYVVDDDPSVRRSLVRILSRSGWRVQAYASGSDFLEAYEAGQSGCIVLDLRMPDMSGLEVQMQLVARGNTMPVIVVTAFSDMPITDQVMQAGAIAVLEKPVWNQRLLTLIEQITHHQFKP